MTSGEQSLSGISSRRFACDRCRASKAKCLRQNLDQARCDRCSRIDSQCVTTPVFRIRSWQPPDAAGDTLNGSGEDGRKANKRPRRSESQDQFPTPTASDFPPDSHDDTVRRGRNFANASTLHQAHDRNSGSSGLNLSNASLFGEELDAAMGTMFDSHIENAFDLNLPEEIFGTITPAMTGDETTGTYPSIHHPPTNGIQDQLPTEFSQEYSAQASRDITGEDGREVHIETTPTPLQQLSKLDYDLITLSHRLNQSHPSLVMRTLAEEEISSSPSAVDDILKGTTKFADVLKLLAESCLPPSTVLPSSADSHRSSSRSTTRTSRSGSYTSDCDSSSCDRDSPNQSSPSGQPAHQELDTPSLLLVITAYIRLLKIHSNVFAGIYQYIKELSERENPHLRPVAGLRMSGFPMGKIAPRRKTNNTG
ncbi:hypothetical protein PG993_007039 [Apiospora rasikravindrae]|uniref:Zn(2)-C6 fungal-type domain-containing protein n=1 Tax=Apiospora rasikravindrae TaxID=990691 RepID=A0ABR1SYM0_9PEZI